MAAQEKGERCGLATAALGVEVDAEVSGIDVVRVLRRLGEDKGEMAARRQSHRRMGRAEAAVLWVPAMRTTRGPVPALRSREPVLRVRVRGGGTEDIGADRGAEVSGLDGRGREARGAAKALPGEAQEESDAAGAIHSRGGGQPAL